MALTRRPILLTVICAIAAGLAAFAAVSVLAQSDASRLERVRRDIAGQRYDRAEEELESLVRRANGEDLRESLFLLAGLQREVPDAESLYRRVIDSDPSGEWSARSYLELAKIQYALGNYDRCYRMLVDSRACRDSEEACLFEGLAALSMKEYNEARRSLARIRRGKLRTWAYLSLAEAESGMQRQQDACERYEALASAMISPTALYRYGECLEDEGDTRGALDEFRRIIDNFPGTPEAVLAAEKLDRISGTPEPEPPAQARQFEPEPAEELRAGFTVQFGSFQDRANAIKLASQIKAVFPGVRIDSELIRYREHHRVRYGYFRTREEAEKTAKQISREMNVDYSIMPLP